MKKSSSAFAVLAGLLLCTSGAIAQTPLVIGSSNTATAAAPETRPNTNPCVVQLFQNFVADKTTKAEGFAPQPFSYNPPGNCPGPWAKVVIAADYSVEAGHQLDRTTDIFIGAAIMLYGVSMEPSAAEGKTWHAERDVTDFTAILEHPQQGQVTLQSFLSPRNPSRIFGSAFLQFYPATAATPAARVPDVVLPIAGDPVLGKQVFITGADTLTRTFTMPRNIERAFLDVTARNAIDDEFDYLCVPDDAIANALQTCGSTSFREVEVSIDGQPAGVAPAFSHITPGSIDPFLWRPTPAVDILNYRPYRVDLTPFAGLLSDGQLHSFSIRVINANPFGVEGAVFLFLDKDSSQVTGAIEANTLHDPVPITEEEVQTDNGTTTGTITVSMARDFKIRGFVNTSHGRVITEVRQSVAFRNTQKFKIANGGNVFDQDVKQITSVQSRTTTRGGGRDGDGHGITTVQTTEFPLEVALASTINPDGSLTQKAAVHQAHNERSTATRSDEDKPLAFSVTQNSVSSADTIFFSPSFDIVGNQGQSSSQNFFSRDSGGHCFSREIASANGLLKSVDDGDRCSGDRDKR